MVFETSQRIDSTINIDRCRGQQGELSQELVAMEFEGSLKTYVENKWFDHICVDCKDRTIVCDGNAKLVRYAHIPSCVCNNIT